VGGGVGFFVFCFVLGVLCWGGGLGFFCGGGGGGFLGGVFLFWGLGFFWGGFGVGGGGGVVWGGVFFFLGDYLLLLSWYDDGYQLPRGGCPFARCFVFFSLSLFLCVFPIRPRD